MSATVAPVVSVCIANYNGAQMLRECIESVQAQDCTEPLEILVHDDASTDDSLALLRAAYPRVRVIESEANVGFCVANNRMAAAARGKYLLLLNNDAALAPDALGSLLASARACASPQILTLPQYDWQTGELVDYGCWLDPFYNPIPNKDPSRGNVAYVIGACLWIPRDLWNLLGGFPEWMGSLGEDLYLCGIARLRGIRVGALASSGYRHHQGATFGGNRGSTSGLKLSVKRRRLSELNKTRALVVLTPSAVVWPLLLVHLTALLAEGLALSIALRDASLLCRIYVAAATSVVKDMPRLQRIRKEVQATRTIDLRRWFAPFRWQLRKAALLLRFGIPKPDEVR